VNNSYTGRKTMHLTLIFDRETFYAQEYAKFHQGHLIAEIIS
jgi:hypothetical protein